MGRKLVHIGTISPARILAVNYAIGGDRAPEGYRLLDGATRRTRVCDVDYIPQIQACDVHDLYASTYRYPVLYLQVGDDEDGDTADMTLRVWDAKLVPYERIVLRQDELLDRFHPEDNNADRDAVINEMLPELQEDIDRIATKILEDTRHAR